MAPSPASEPRELSRPVTVAIASIGSVVAAIVVSKIWGPGTLIGAAATPVIITLVVEGLRKPVETVVVRTPTGTQVHEVGRPRPRTPDPSDEPTMVAGPEVPPEQQPGRRRLKFALITGLIAFVIGAAVLTTTELVLGDSVGGGDTTYFNPAKKNTSTKTTKTVTTPKTPTVTETTTTTTPTEPTETAEETAPPVVPEGTTGETGASGATGTTP